MVSNLDLRPSPIAGRWYPASPQELLRTLDTYLAQAEPPQIDGHIVGIMVPHAGVVYSGPVAAHAFKLIRGYSPDVVVLISPMHHPYPYELLTSGHDAYHTPLGDIEIDRDGVDRLDAYLRQQTGIGLTPVRMDPEHAVEIELPFLQHILEGSFRLLPLMLRDQTRQMCHAIGQGLAEVLEDADVLLVASSDLSHFYTQERAKELDLEVLRRVEAFDPQAVIRMEDEEQGFACGRGAIASVMWGSQAFGADQATTVGYGTSGDITGDYQQVVGYGAAVFSRKEG